MSKVALPATWTLRRVGDCLRLQNGYPFKPSDWLADGLPIIRIQNLNNADAPFNHFRGNLPERFRARNGDLLFAWSGTPGTSFGAHVWQGGDAWINQHIFRVDFSPAEFDRDFLRLALNDNLRAYIAAAQGGVGLAHITKAKLNESFLVSPSLPEQRSIAERAAFFENLRNRSSAHLLASGRVIERFHEVALAVAYRRAAGGDDESGELVPLGSVLSEPLKNGYSARPVNHETPYRVLTLTSTTSGWFDSHHFKYTDEAFAPDSPFWVQPNDILVQRGNTAEYVGVPAVYEGRPGEFLYPDLMIRVRVPEDIGARFVWYMLLAPQARQYLRDRATGSAGNMPKINQTILSSVPIPLPNSALRWALVAELDAAFDLAKKVELRIGSAARRVELSSKATLAKAFRGELLTS